MGTDFLSEEYLTRVKASIVESHKDFIGIADTEGRLIYLNEAAYQMMGYGAEDRPHFNTIADVHANDFDKFALEVIQPAVFANGAWSGMGFIKHKSGKALTVAQQVFPVYDEDGTVYGTVGIMRDISEIAELNRQLDVKNEIFQKVMDTAKVGIVLINMQTNTIEMANSCTQELLQKDASEIVGQKCYDVLCHRDPSICPHINERDKASIVAERFLERSDGSMLPIIKTGTWIDIEGKEYLVDTLVDITIQKELEKNLIEAKISAEAANRSKSEFLSRMSHEMRTPLNAIIGMIQIADRTDDAAKLKEALSTIEISSNHLLGLINDVLDLSKIEEGKLELNIEPFSPKLMLEKIMFLINPKAKEKGIAFIENTDVNIPDILEGDSMRLSQVLLNLLSNAVKFTPREGTIEFSACCEALTEEAATVCFTVKDNGIGMTQEQLGRLFSPFVQADGSVSRKYGGTGLGLVISKRIVGLMNSTIDVETTYGQGSKFAFRVDLPVSEKASAADLAFNTDSFKDILKDKRVLIVDDVEINRMIAAELLSITGIITDEAADGREAADKAARIPYDVILMDIQMPIMDGYEATKLIRSMGGVNANTPIIAMSANVFKDDVKRSLDIGMNGHIGKPIELRSMVETISRVIVPSGAMQQAAAEADADTDALFAKLVQAMGRREYEEAARLAKELQKSAKIDKPPIICSYAGNVYECLCRNDYDYAGMYMADLIRAYRNADASRASEA